jgi:hypothetical protein
MKARKFKLRGSPVYALLIQSGTASSKIIVKFTGPKMGRVVACADGLLAVGHFSDSWYEYNKESVWKILPDYETNGLTE